MAPEAESAGTAISICHQDVTMKKLRWGVLSTAKIGQTKVIPAIQASTFNTVTAIASRNVEVASRAAANCGISKAYGSYEELLADPDIDVIYNPLPNHLHVPWSIKALRAGKHVLCEKPLGLNTADAEKLVAEAALHPHLLTMEAFMYRFHPQWKKAIELVRENAIGPLRSIHSQFSYNNREIDNIRNSADMGGGALMDIGCYCISLSRWLFNQEPQQVIGQVAPFENYEVDCLVSGIMQFPAGLATFTAATKIEGSQFVEACGELGKIRIPLPFSPEANSPTHITLTKDHESCDIPIEPSDHYREMADAVALAILDKAPAPTPLSDAINNMRIIDAIFESVRRQQWQNVSS